MERLYSITKKELLKLYELSELNSLIKEDHEFEKWLLELEKNIALGNNLNGTIFDKHYIKDDKINIVKKSGSLFINPSPFEKEKQKISTIAKKTSLLIKNNWINSIIIQDMIIDNNFIFENLNAYRIIFENCYFTDTFVFNLKKVSELEFSYCDLPNFNIFSNNNISNLLLIRSKFRQESSKFNKIKAKIIDIDGTSLNYKHLFYTSSFENLEELKINTKIFNDADIIMLNQIAPVLKKVRLNIVLKDLNTFSKINPMVYFTFKFQYDSIERFDENYNFISNSEIKYKLTDINLRNQIIENIEEAINSVYKNIAYKKFSPREILHKEIYENIEEYKINNNKDRLLENIIFSLNNLKENIINEDMDIETKEKILIEIDKMKEDPSNLERSLVFGLYGDIQFNLDSPFKYLYNNLNDMKFFAQTKNYTCVTEDGSVRNPLFVDKSVKRMEEILNNYKNKKKTNFDFFEILALTELNIPFMYIFKKNRNFNFYKNIYLNKKEIELINPAIKDERLSSDEILEILNIKENTNNLGMILPYNENDLFKDQLLKIDIEKYYKEKNFVEFRMTMKNLMERQIPKTKHEIIISKCSFDKYRQIHQTLKKYKSGNYRLSKFMEIYGNNEEYNLEDYKIYLENYNCRNDNIVYEKICLNILYENKEKLYALTPIDYEKIKMAINEKYTCRDYNMELYYYYEIINYITKSYPDFLTRHIKNCFVKEEQKHIYLLKYMKEDIKKRIIEEFDKSRTDYEIKQKIIIKNNSDILKSSKET